MATWDDLIEHVRESYELSHDADDQFAFIWTFEDQGARDEQELCGFRRDAEGSTWLELCATIAGAHRLSAAAALARNAELMRGSLCERGGRLILRMVVDLTTATAESIDETLLAMGRQAVSLRTVVYAEPAPDALAFWGN